MQPAAFMARTTNPRYVRPQIIWSVPTVLRQTLTLFVLAGLATSALAQETRASVSAKFKAEFAARDTNKDGVLTRAEVQAGISQMKVGPGRPDPVHAKRLAELWFSSADTNKDGQLSKAEFDAAKGPMHGGPRHGGPRDGAAPKPQR